MKLIDHDGSGTIEYNEFVQWWKNQDRFKDMALDDATLHFRQVALRVYLQEAAASFLKFDAERTGAISSHTFPPLFQELKARGLTGDLTLERCLEDLDTDGDSIIEFNVDFSQSLRALHRISLY